jgi:hypothetical protein
MDSTVAIILGAAISGIVGVLVVFLQQRLARQHELDSAKAARLSEFSAARWAATLIMSELARAPVEKKHDIENSARFQALTDRFNSVLAQIQLLDDNEIYAAAHRVDTCLVALHHQARAAQATREDWRSGQQAELSIAVAEYQRVARRVLGARPLPGLEPWQARAAEPDPASVRYQGGQLADWICGLDADSWRMRQVARCISTGSECPSVTRIMNPKPRIGGTARVLPEIPAHAASCHLST